MIAGKDTLEVIKFMKLFARLKDCCEDDPESLVEIAATDVGVKELCDEVFFASLSLTMSEREQPELFSSPVDPKFLGSWREYEERYGTLLAIVWLGDPLLDPNNCVADGPDVRWANAEDTAFEQTDAIEQAIDFANDQISQRWRDFSEEYRDQVEDGIRAWRRLKTNVGFDLADCLRRRNLVPFVLIPRHVAKKYGDTEKLTLLKSLQQAHDAFVFGAPFAALALMRSIMEAVLRDHYQVPGKNLKERIHNAHRRFPKAINEHWLERLRLRANSILHFNAGAYDTLPEVDDVELEKEIISLLFVLRAMIEETPVN